MKFKEINSVEFLTPSFGTTFTDRIDIRGVHNKAFSMMQGFSVRRGSDDMQMRQVKFFTKTIKDPQNSTAIKTRFIVTTKIVHLGVEDDFWVDDSDELYISYAVLVIVPESNN